MASRGTIDSYDGALVTPLGVSRKHGVVRSTFLVPPDLVRLAMSAKRIGHLMKPSGHAPSFGVSVDIDERSSLMVRTFLGSCRRRQAKE